MMFVLEVCRKYLEFKTLNIIARHVTIIRHDVNIFKIFF
jgi:hypothetical protein